jgi:5'-3' exonuclease
MVDLIFDASSFWARAYFVAQAKPGTSYSAERVQRDPVDIALKTVTSMLRNSSHYFGRHVDRTLFCWDGEKQKSPKHRPQEKPADYIPKLEEFATHLGPMFNAAQARLIAYEADDVVASACERSSADQVIVVSGDKDLRQLQTKRIWIYDLHEKMLLTRNTICAKFGIHAPIQVAIALAIIGDPGDGIDGVSGWGKKKVEKLFSTIDPATPFDKVVDALLAQMDEKRAQEFLMSLEMTLLDTAIEGIPEAAQVAIDDALVAELEARLADFPFEQAPGRGAEVDEAELIRLARLRTPARG